MAPAPHLEDAAQPLARLEQIQGQAARTTIQLGADFLSYARATSTPVEFKHQLVERLLPTVPRRGQPYLVKEGASFGKFTIAEQLGKGGMAVVYRAVDPERGSGSGSGSVERRQQVALKVMREDISHDPEYVRRFLREAANAALIDHPNVVRVHEVGSVKGRLYFTMELIEGETLKETLARGPLPEEQGLQVLCQLVDGLIAAHERGIGHRDLKPSNIMLITGRTRYGLELEGDDFDVQVKVTDFGLAHMLDADTSDVMPEGRFLGTAKYVAPEVIKGGETTLKSDLFSLGVLAFQMFAGRAPFAARSKLEFITANLQAEAPPLDSVAPVSRDLARLVDAMLKKEPAERPDAISLRRDLGRLAGRRTRRERVVVADDPSSAFHRGLPDAPRRAAPAGVIIGAAAGLVVVVVALALVLRRPPPPPLPDDRPPPPPVTEVKPPGPATPAEPGRVRGSDDLPWVPLPAAASFPDAMARLQFTRGVEQGDAAWAAGRVVDALGHWEGAERVAPEPLEPLRARVRGARREAALARAADAERRGNTSQAIVELEAALTFGADAASVEERLERARALRELQQRLTEARALRVRDPEGAARILEDLLPVARRLGPSHLAEVQLALGRIRGTPDAPPPPATEAPPPRTRADELLDQAEGYLREQLHGAADRALHNAREAGATGVRVERLVARLTRARNAPDGYVYLEVAPADGGEPHGFYALPRRVTHRELHAWFEVANARAALMPPRVWRGAGHPPKGSEDRPIEGLEAELARAFAAARGDRLPTAAELEAVRAHAGEAAPAGALAEGRLDHGFFTVKDVGGR